MEPYRRGCSLIADTGMAMTSQNGCIVAPVCSTISAGLQTVLQINAPSLRLSYPTHSWLWRLQGQRYPIYVSLVSPSPKFQSVSPHDLLFSSYAPFETSAMKEPKITLKGQESTAPSHVYTKTTRVGANFRAFRSTLSCFKRFANVYDLFIYLHSLHLNTRERQFQNTTPPTVLKQQ